MTARPVTSTRQPRPDSTGPVATARSVVRAVVTAYLEVEAGLRPLAQLSRVLDPALSRRMARHLQARPREPVVDAIVSIRMCRVTPVRMDAAVVVRGRSRIGVVAVALERSCEGWRVTELARPEYRAEVA